MSLEILSGFISESTCCRPNPQGSGRYLSKAFDPRYIDMSKNPDDALREEILNRQIKEGIAIDQFAEVGSDFRSTLDECSRDHLYGDCVCLECMTKLDIEAIPSGIQFEVRDARNEERLFHKVFNIIMSEKDAQRLGFSVA